MEMGYLRPTRILHPTGHSDWSGLGELVILAGPISVLFQNLIWIRRDVERRKRNEKQVQSKTDRDSYLVKSQKPLSGPMREKRVGSMCVGWGKEYTLQCMRSRRVLWASSANQYKTNVRTLKEFSPWWSIEKKNVLLATAAFCRGLSHGCSQSRDEAITEEAQLGDGGKKTYF